MISLDGIELDDSLIWQDRFESSGVSQSARRSLGGAAIVFVAPLGAGVPITLVATANFGWFSKAMVDALRARAAVPGGVFELIYGAESFSVMFRHQDAPALDLQPQLDRQTQLASDNFTGSLKLMTV